MELELTYKEWNSKPLSERMAIAAEHIRLFESGVHIQYKDRFPGSNGRWVDLEERDNMFWNCHQQFHQYIWRVAN